MKLEHRLQRLELEIKIKRPGCSPTLFIVVPDTSRTGLFDADAYGPTDGEIEEYLSYLKDGGRCGGCLGSCAIDWSPDRFTNHTLTGAQSSSSPEPKISRMYCANTQIPILTRRLTNGERTGLEK
jgi:hypothetical protein